MSFIDAAYYAFIFGFFAPLGTVACVLCISAFCIKCAEWMELP